MLNLKKKLQNKLEGAGKIALLGIGSELRGDDIAGLLVAEKIKEKSKNRNLKVFIGGTAPENLTGEIKKFNPGHLVIVDTAEFAGKPGDIRVLDKEEIGGVSFSTHMLPTSIMIGYLQDALKCGVTIIGIQPKSMEFGSSPSKKVINSVNKAASLILQIIQ